MAKASQKTFVTDDQRWSGRVPRHDSFRTTRLGVSIFLAKLKEKLKDPEFRNIEGFPIGEDEDILALSDPPYFTACPNPFLGAIS